MSAATGNPFLLLLRNELRLYLRSGAISGTSVTFLVIGQVLLHGIALVMAIGMSMQSGVSSPGDARLILLTSGLLAMLMLMTSRSLAGAVQSLYTRGDLDLLLASPVDRRAILGVRMGAIVLTVALEVALLVWPFANVFVLFGRFVWFKAYLLVPAMAMLATSIGLALTLLSFRTLGPRRTRVAVQVLAVIMGTGMMLAFYLPQMLQKQQGRQSVPGAALGRFMRNGGEYHDLLVMPAQWVSQGFLPTLAFFAASLALIVTTIHLVGDRVVATLTSITGGSTRATARPGTEALSFRGGFRSIVVFKELKLIARDPFLIVQMLAQSIYTLPMAFVLWRSPIGADQPIAWLSVIALAAGLAAPLSWLTIVAEDAPDLLASAPVTSGALMRSKLEAALLPVLPICLLPLFFVLTTHPWFAVSTTFCAMGASLSAAVLNMRNPATRRRDSFKTRHKGGGANGFLEALSMVLWILVCVGLIYAGRLAGWR